MPLNENPDPTHEYYNENDNTWYRYEKDQNGNYVPKKIQIGSPPKDKVDLNPNIRDDDKNGAKKWFFPHGDARNRVIDKNREKNGVYSNATPKTGQNYPPMFREHANTELKLIKRRIIVGVDANGNPIYEDIITEDAGGGNLPDDYMNNSRTVWEPIKPRGDWDQQKIKPHVIFITDFQRGSSVLGQSLKLWLPPKDDDWTKPSQFQTADVAGQLAKPREWTGAEGYKKTLKFPLILDWKAGFRYDVWPVMMWLKMCQGHLLRIVYCTRTTDEAVTVGDFSDDRNKHGSVNTEAYAVVLDNLSFNTKYRHGLTYFPEYVEVTMEVSQR